MSSAATPPPPSPGSPGAQGGQPYPGQGPYPSHGHGQPGPGQRTNVLAIVSLVTSIIGLSLVGVICGHIALSQIRKSGEGGRGLAIAGLVIGYIGLVIGLILLVVWIGIVIAAVNSGGMPVAPPS